MQERTQNMEKLKCELALQLQLIQQQQAGGAAPGPSGHMQSGAMMPHYMPGEAAPPSRPSPAAVQCLSQSCTFCWLVAVNRYKHATLTSTGPLRFCPPAHV